MSTQRSAVAVTGLPIRRLGEGDLPACVALAVGRGWEPAENKWQLIFELGEVFGVDDPAGGLAGAVALTRFGPGLAAIGKMLVAARHGRQGLGGRLMTHALGQLDGELPCLLATSLGRPLYERLGFRAVDSSVRYIGPFTPEQPGAASPGPAVLPAPRPLIRPAAGGDLPGLAALDRLAFGADRSRLLARLPEAPGRLDVAVPPAGGEVSGFAASWLSPETLTIGPIVADGLATATALVTGLADGSELPLRLEVPGRHPGLADWAAARGLTVRSESTLMVRGGELPGAREQLFGPVNMAMT